MKRNLTPTDMFNQLVEDAFYSRSHNKVLVLRDDEKVWDVFANVVVYSELTDELLSNLHREWFEEEVLALLMSKIEVEAV
jgi:hypothetical protein